MFAIVKGLRPTAGSGVILDCEWYRSDPGDDRDARPDLIDSLLIPAPDILSVTDAMIDEALEIRMPQVEKELAPPEQPKAAVRAMLGKSHEIKGRK